MPDGSATHGIGRLRQGETTFLEFRKVLVVPLIVLILITSLSLQLGYSEDAKIESAVEYDKLKEKEGYVAGKHIDGRVKWWFQRLW